ncbi:MAG TPA: DUF1054 domain-containing protein [Pseudogracilibacillus sp.]|nr:DUF1054 domain-containing protein [Pseudogracilibacillus sp.]
MTFNGFKQSDFDVFTIEGLDERMTAIQEKIQPKFQQIGNQLVDDVSAIVGSEMYLHIAKHARRTVNPPNDTWLAIAGNKRGYKKHPHFQVGLWDDRLFIWLAFIYELPDKSKIARNFIDNAAMFEELPKDFHISLNHMKKDAESLENIDLEKALGRFRDVKKAEFLIGKQLSPTDSVVHNGGELIDFIKQVYQQLIPFYRLAYA